MAHKKSSRGVNSKDKRYGSKSISSTKGKAVSAGKDKKVKVSESFSMKDSVRVIKYHPKHSSISRKKIREAVKSVVSSAKTAA